MMERIENHLAKEMHDAISSNPSNLLEIIQTAARGQVLDNDTGLYNARGFAIAKNVARKFLNEGRVSSVGVLIIDVDGLKETNDTHGHDAGTKLLQDLAAVLQVSVRSDDNVFRIGGDEFAILMANVDDTILKDRITKIGKERDKHRNDMRFSWGIGYADSADKLEKAIKTADQSMYKYKRIKKR